MPYISAMRLIKRLAGLYAFNPEWAQSKMLFLAGPRQIGKTYLAREQLKKQGCSKLYYNFDIPEVSDQFRQDPFFFQSAARQLNLARPWVVFDEVHKRSKWKNELKGIYDQSIESFNLIVTGSARLDLLRTTGESLAGRYFLFRIFPIGLQEYTNKLSSQCNFTTFKELVQALEAETSSPSELIDLLELGGFPDPLSHGEKAYR